MNKILRRLFPFLFFLGMFAVFFYFCYPYSKMKFAGGDIDEIYHDSFYRAGYLRPFDFRVITQSGGSNTYYLPFVTVTYNLIFSNFGRVSAPFFFVGFTLHALNALILYFVVKELAQETYVALLSSILFLFYPTNLQLMSVVGWSFAHPLTNLFCLVSLGFFLKFLKIKTPWLSIYLASLLFFLMACFAKISALNLIPILVMADGILCIRSSDHSRYGWFERGVRRLEKYIPFLFVSLIFITIAMILYPTGEVARSWGGMTFSSFSFLRFSDLLMRLVLPFYRGGEWSLFCVMGTSLLFPALFVWGNRLIKFLVLWLLTSLWIFTVSNFRDTETIQRYLYYAATPFAIMLSVFVGYVVSRIKEFVFRHVA